MKKGLKALALAGALSLTGVVFSPAATAGEQPVAVAANEVSACSFVRFVFFADGGIGEEWQCIIYVSGRV